MSSETDLLQDTTRARLDAVSQALLRLHKSLLDDERIIYEAANGTVSPNEMFRLALGHPQFTWLGKILSLVAQLDEAASVRRPATETKAQSLLVEAHVLLKMEHEDQTFVARFQHALTRSTDASEKHKEALEIVTTESEQE
ncbi:MAG TPA: hypothetical protein VFZ34_18070 [Blastocatellia bacterium]|nr:hypothetical protein [Blastocatellia bacterium]